MKQPLRFRSVEAMVRHLHADDPDFVKSCVDKLRRDRLSNELVALRLANGGTEVEFRKALGWSKLRLRRFEHTGCDYMRPADVIAYMTACGCSKSECNLVRDAVTKAVSMKLAKRAKALNKARNSK